MSAHWKAAKASVVDAILSGSNVADVGQSFGISPSQMLDIIDDIPNENAQWAALVIHHAFPYSPRKGLPNKPQKRRLIKAAGC